MAAGKYDVVVVGAGPAGAATARKCTAGGLKTLLIDRHQLPRRKACSGIIANKTQNFVLEKFGPIPLEAYGKPNISCGMAFYFPSVGTVFTNVDCFMLYVWRDKFDHFLAKSSGAELKDKTRFVNLKDLGEEFEVVCEQNNKKVTYKTRYVVGADGANSHVIRKFAPEVYAGIPWAFACQKYYEGTIDADDRYLYWFLTPGMGPFPWINLKDDQIIIGSAFLMGPKFAPNHDMLIEFLKKNFNLKIKRELATEGCIANVMGALNRFFPGRGRVLMVGDAMGLMHQGGEGISCALVSGEYAGEAITQAIKGGADALSVYKRLVRPEMEITLDQFNPLRMKSTTASSTANQPGILSSLSAMEKVKAAKDALSFLKSEFQIEGLAPTVAKNIVHRLIHGKYDIPAAN